MQEPSVAEEEKVVVEEVREEEEEKEDEETDVEEDGVEVQEEDMLSDSTLTSGGEEEEEEEGEEEEEDSEMAPCREEMQHTVPDREQTPPSALQGKSAGTSSSLSSPNSGTTAQPSPGQQVASPSTIGTPPAVVGSTYPPLPLNTSSIALVPAPNSTSPPPPEREHVCATLEATTTSKCVDMSVFVNMYEFRSVWNKHLQVDLPMIKQIFSKSS